MSNGWQHYVSARKSRGRHWAPRYCLASSARIAPVCPQCGGAALIYDHQERRWRHLDTCQFPTIVHAHIPRLKCPTDGVRQIPVPWAKAGSRFTSMNVQQFDSIADAHRKIEAWRTEYNGLRPHGSLGDLTPDEFIEQGQVTRVLEVADSN